MIAGVNSHGINTTPASVIVGVLSAVTLSLATSASAYVTAGGSSQGSIDTTVASHVSRQIHNAIHEPSTLGVSGQFDAVRHAANPPSLYGLPLDTTHTAYVQAGAESNGSLLFDGNIRPKVFLLPEVLPPSFLTWQAEHIGYPTKKGIPLPVRLAFGGYHFTPRIITVWDMAAVTSFKGYCIAANHLGYGQPITTELVAAHDATVLRHATHTLTFSLEPQPLQGIYNTAEGFSAGVIGVSAHVNIQINEIHHFEQDATLFDADISHVPSVVRHARADGHTGITYEQQSIALRNGRGMGSFGGFYRVLHHDKRIAAPIAPPVLISISGTAYGDIQKETATASVLTLSGSHSGVCIVEALHEPVTLSSAVTHDALRTAITPQSCDLVTGCQASGERWVIQEAVSVASFTGENTYYTQAGGLSNGAVAHTGSHTADIMFTMRPSRFESRVAHYGQRVHRGYSGGAIAFSGVTDHRIAIHGEADGSFGFDGSMPDARIAIRGEADGSFGFDGSMPDVRTAIRGEADGSFGFDGSMPDVRTAIRGEADGSFGFSGVTDHRIAIRHEASYTLSFLIDEFSATNIFAKAPTDRQLNPVPKDDRTMAVPNDNRSMEIVSFDPAVYIPPVDYMLETTPSMNTHGINDSSLN